MSSKLIAQMTLSIRDKWSRNSKRFKKDMQGLSSSSRKLRGEFKGVSNDARKMAAATDGSTRAMQRQSGAARRLESDYARLERRKRAIIKLTEKERQKRNERAMFGASVAGAGVASMLAGRQALRPVAASANQFGNFEEAMDAVAAVARVDQASETYSILAAKARELGATTSYSAIEAAQGMNFLAMAGMSPDEMLASMESVLALAKATKTELAGTADISSNILSGFGLDATEMGRVADVLTATTTRANVDLIMLGESMKYAAPIAKQLGVSLEETAAMAGLLGNVGIQGSMAGTSLRTIYTRLAAPNKRARAALAALKVETKDLKGNLRPVPELLLEIAKASQNMGTGKRAELFKDIAGAEAGTAFASLLDEQGFEVFKSLLADLKDVKGEAKRVSGEMGNNWVGDKKALGSAISEIALVFGESLNPALRETTQWLTKQARQFGEWLKENPKITKAIAFTAAALSGFLIVGGGLLTFLGTSIALLAGMRFGMFMLGLSAKTSAGSIGLIGTALRTVIGGVTGAFTGIAAGIATATAPVWGTIAAIVAAIAAVGLAVYNYWEPISEFVSGFASVLSGAISEMSSAIGNWAKESVIDLATMLGFDSASVSAAIDQTITSAKAIGSSIASTVMEIPSMIGDWMGDIFTMNRYSETAKASFRQAGVDAGQAMVDAVKAAINNLISWFKSLPGRIVAAIGKIDLTSLIKWPSMPSWLGGSSKKSDGAAVQKRASGGAFGRGPLLVGEKGPELEYSNRSGFIAHNNQLKNMVSMSRKIRRYAAASAITAGVAAAPVAGVAAEPILPALNAAEAKASASKNINVSVTVPIGNVTASDSNIEARIQTAVNQAVNDAVEQAMSRLSDRLGDD